MKRPSHPNLAALIAAILLVLGFALPSFAAVQTTETPRTFPPIDSVAQWRERAGAIREQILVDAGLWPMPEKTPLNAKVFGRIERDGYSVEKVYFESVPGFYVCGNLYRPLGRGAGPFPATLVTHGHWEHGRLEDTDVCSFPGLCINFARQGIIAFSYDMVGYNDTHFADAPRAESFEDIHKSFAANIPAALLWNVTLMGLQTWNSIRALDFLASLPDADKSRLACTGASGGGTQTFILGAIDDRLAAQAPVVMVSHSFQGGCECENMPGLRLRYSNMEIAAAAAPRPQILVSDTNDWTKTTLTIEGPAIEHIYDLFGAPENLRYVRFDCRHNYNQQSRQAVYQWFDHALLHAPDQPVSEISFKKEPDRDLRVFLDGNLPGNALTESNFIANLIQRHQEQLLQLDPTNDLTLQNYKSIMAPTWRDTLQLDWPMKSPSTVVRQLSSPPHYSVAELSITPEPGADAIRAIELTPLTKTASSLNVVIIVDPRGPDAFLDSSNTPRDSAKIFLENGYTVVIMDPLRAQQSPALTSLFFTTYNRTRLQEYVRDVTYVCSAVKSSQSPKPRVILVGHAIAGLWCLFAAPAADTVVADCDQLDPSSDQMLLSPDLFCPGIRNIDTVQSSLILAAPHPALLHNTSASFPVSHVQACYETVHSPDKFRVEKRGLSDEEIILWLKAL